MVLRDRIIENTTKAAELFDWCFHRWFLKSRCRSESIDRAADTWRDGRQDVRELLPKWADLSLKTFDHHHPWPLAERVAEVLRERYAHSITIDGLAREFGYARTRITREFRTDFGMSVATYLTRVRVHHGLRTLRMTAYSVDAVAREIGYRSPKNFYAALQSLTGVSPSAVRALSSGDFDALLGSVLPPQSVAMRPIRRRLTN
jgi:AraC-like DNA-binding protein